MVLAELARNELFWTLLAAVVVSQGLKFLNMRIQRVPLSASDLAVTGGMPSSHTALVCGLTLILYLQSGFSAGFFIAFVLAVIVIRDALGVRRTAGEEGQALNTLIKRSKLRIPELHYARGHTPSQVVVGALIGLASAGIVHALLA